MEQSDFFKRVNSIATVFFKSIGSPREMMDWVNVHTEIAPSFIAWLFVLDSEKVVINNISFSEMQFPEDMDNTLLFLAHVGYSYDGIEDDCLIPLCTTKKDCVTKEELRRAVLVYKEICKFLKLECPEQETALILEAACARHLHLSKNK